MPTNEKVAVLTTLYNWDRAYSLVSVIEAQLTALVKYGYSPVLFVHDNFKDDASVPQGVEIRKVVPRFHLVDYSAHQPVADSFKEQVAKTYEFLKSNLEDIDVVIAHDIIFQGWFLPYAVAIHRYAKESKVKWLHWTHSVPNMKPEGLEYPHTCRYELPANSKLVYLNNYGLIRAAESYSAWPKDVRISYNPVDPRLYWNTHPLVNSLIDKYGILSAEFVQIYPVSSTRMVDGKGLPILIDIFAELKKLGHSVKLIIANAHANAEWEKKAIADMRQRAIDKGMNATDIIFTSLEDAPKYELGVPRDVVSQLFQLSNLFIFPTRSENCPLILLEAMLAKCLLVLNANVGSLREIAQENALYFSFGSIDDRVTINDERKYAEDIAKIIVSEFNTNRALKANWRLRRDFNYDYLFRHQIEPIINE